MLPKAGKPTWFLRRASSAKIEEHVIDFIPAYTTKKLSQEARIEYAMHVIGGWLGTLVNMIQNEMDI